MTIDEIIDYVTHSPENTNPNVLKSMLNNVESGQTTNSSDRFIEVEINDGVLNKTWEEIEFQSTDQGNICYIIYDYDIWIAHTSMESYNNITNYIVTFKTIYQDEYKDQFYADSPDDYPKIISTEPSNPDLPPFHPLPQ